MSSGQTGLPRRISARIAAALVVANMVGTGIFTTSGFIARDVGSPGRLMALWLVGGVIALAGALSYAELGAALPEAGGEYVYLRAAYGPLAASLSGWTSFFAGFSGATAAALLAVAGYLHHFIPAIDASGASGTMAALIMLWALTFAHLAGSRAGARVQGALTGATIATMFACIAAAALFGRGSIAHFSTPAPARGSIAVALVFVIYSYSGWNAAAYVAGEIRDPGRSLPRTLIGGTAIVAALYIGMNAVYLYAMPVDAMAGVLPIGERAAAMLFGPAAASAVTAILIIALLGSVSAMVMAGPRIYYAMARDGLAPSALARANSGFGTPAAAIVSQSLWTSVLMLFFGTFEPIVVYTGLAITIFSAMAVAALIVLRVRRPNLARPFRVPAYPWLPLAYVGAAAWIAIYTAIAQPLEVAVAMAVVAAGIPFHLAAARTHRREVAATRTSNTLPHMRNSGMM